MVLQPFYLLRCVFIQVHMHCVTRVAMYLCTINNLYMTELLKIKLIVGKALIHCSAVPNK